MSTSKKQTDISQDIVKWLMVGLLTVSLCFVNLKMTTLSTPVMSIIWILWFVATIAIVSFTSVGKMGLAFMTDAKLELLKVVWPTRQETIQMTMIIMVVVFVISMILWGVDSSLLWLVGKLTSLK
tara:strand:- start:700 stop:1074 length:375 start_codon:yes stop_codon:yes gene_type:complete